MPVTVWADQQTIALDIRAGCAIEQQVAQPEFRQVLGAGLFQSPFEQAEAGHAVEPAVDAHSGQLYVDQQRLRYLIRARLEQPWGKGAHRAALLAPEHIAQLAARQPAGRVGNALLLLFTPAALHCVQCQFAQTPLHQTIDHERLVGGNAVLGIGQAQAQALLQKEFCRVAEAFQQIRGLDLQPAGIRRGQPLDERCRAFQWRCGQAFGGTEPGAGITAPGAAAGEVVRRKGLQRVIDGQPLTGFLRARTGSRLVDHFEQFAEQHRRRQGRVVARVAADVAQVQAMARREQRFQQQIAIIQPPYAVAVARLAADQVKSGGRAAARQGAVIQTEQADQGERQAAHRHHVAEGHSAGEKARSAAALLECRGELLADQRQLNGPLDTTGEGLLVQGGAGLAEYQQGIAGLTFIEQLVDQCQQGFGPFRQAAFGLQALRQRGQALDKRRQPPEQLCPGAFQRIQRPAVTE